MEKSYNGWTASPTPKDFGGLAELRVGTETFPPGVRAGAVHTVLSYVATQLDRRVEPVAFPGGHPADDWGWNYRPNKNNPATLSCHASGTAFDYNATRHPNGRSGTWSAKQATEIKKILAEVDNVVRCLWGYDEMHFEVVASPATVAMVADRLTGGGVTKSPITTLPVQEDDMFDAPDRDALTRVERAVQTLIDAKFTGGPSMPYGLSEVELIKRLPASTAHEVWNGVFVNRPDGSGALQRVPVIQELADAKTQAAQAAGELAGALAALAAAQSGSGVDLAAIKLAAREGAEEALAGGVRVTVDVPGATVS